MKRPDEIKNALLICSDDGGTCGTCKYYTTNPDCLGKLHADALAYIQQLEREKDAAVAGLADHRDCLYCKHYDTPISEPPCNSCSSRSEEYRLPWEWCGCVPKGGVKINV